MVRTTHVAVGFFEKSSLPFLMQCTGMAHRNSHQWFELPETPFNQAGTSFAYRLVAPMAVQ
jgi:hypothetical protein